MRYIIHSVVKDLERKRKAVKSWVDSSDPDVPKLMWEYEDIGWFVTFENSHESLFMGMTKPDDLDRGTEVEIIIVPKPRKID